MNCVLCFKIQYDAVNQGRCGECGDIWSDPRPRANDEGGLYGTGTIGKTYQQGSVRKVQHVKGIGSLFQIFL